VYVYFDNDAKVHAPFDAMRLAERVGIFPESGRMQNERQGNGLKRIAAD